MDMESVKLAYFSPTGTTRAVVQGIAQGINQGVMEFIDITRPEARKHPLLTSEKELLVVAVPVYMGRTSALLREWLQALQAQSTPTVCVVVYGNRAYDDALLELKNILTQCGCRPLAGAAYIGEHSFSSSETPVAQGRPDENDVSHAQAFGRKIQEMLQSISSVSQISEMHVPGAYPYRGSPTLWNVDFIEVNNHCLQCGACAESCPAGAIDSHNSAMIDQEKCITCCACIKACPQNARTMKPGPVRDASKRLNGLYKEQKQPECFFASILPGQAFS